MMDHIRVLRRLRRPGPSLATATHERWRRRRSRRSEYSSTTMVLLFTAASIALYCCQRASAFATMRQTALSIDTKLIRQQSGSKSLLEIRPGNTKWPCLLDHLSATPRTAPRSETSLFFHAQPIPDLDSNEPKNIDDENNFQSSRKNVQPSQKPISSRTTLDSSRRSTIASLAALSASAFLATPALAGKPELNPQTGELFTPKNEMLSGGSAAARGIDKSSTSGDVKPGQAVQTVYEPRFVAYLSRFLLNFDPAANAYWVRSNKLGDTWDAVSAYGDDEKRTQELAASFAEFAESVEIGLADYFVGPYGSYSSLSAMKAGLNAAVPAKSARAENEEGFLNKILSGQRRKIMDSDATAAQEKDRNRISKQGVLNLYTLLKARYTSPAAKRQLAILFSFISNPDLQPTAEICSLLGEVDNASVTNIQISVPISPREPTSRTSSRRGGGYGPQSTPKVAITPPPALGNEYWPAKATAVMEPTSRVLRIVVTDGGSGYCNPPEVTVVPSGGSRPCCACAVLDREGSVESVIVLDPGYGYGKTRKGADPAPPRVSIASPVLGKDVTDGKSLRRAKAVAELEYHIVGVKVEESGNGFVLSEPPRVSVEQPQCDPDWYLESSAEQMAPLEARVTEMKDTLGNVIDLDAYKESVSSVRRLPLEVYEKNPLELLPSYVRPRPQPISSSGYLYTIAELARIPTFANVPSPRYRAIDPVFGAIGTVPVTKSALELSTGEYARLALSGALCTVIVRTLLNPLELLKTKQQLKNDEELFSFTNQKLKPDAEHHTSKLGPTNITLAVQKLDTTTAAKTEEKVGTLTLAKNLVQLRGPMALFQSADITFLASLVFGSFGFGATELFRRSFTLAFSSDGAGTGTSLLPPEVILLVAAALATILTSAAATPFEVLRVRSMGLVQSKKWTEVLAEFLAEKKKDQRKKFWPRWQMKPRVEKEFSFRTLRPTDLLPLWAGFAPTASRELAFAIPKFLAFDIISKSLVAFLNAQADPGALPVVPGTGTEGLIVSAISGALAGIAGAIVSHPFDLILTFTSTAKKQTPTEGDASGDRGADWREVVKDLLSQEGGVANLFLGLPPRLAFFFLVIGLQFFLYDYVKNLFQVGSDDLSLVLDVFYAVRQGLLDAI